MQVQLRTYPVKICWQDADVETLSRAHFDWQNLTDHMQTSALAK